MSKAQENAKAYFKANPQVEKLHATSDDFLFTNKQDALNHAKTLTDKKLIVIANTGGETKKTPTTKAPAKKTPEAQSEEKQ